MNNSTSLHLNGMNEVLAHLERMRGSGSPPWPPLAMLQTARAVVTCLTPYDLSERERGLGLTAEALQLLLLEVTNSNIGVSNGGTTI